MFKIFKPTIKATLIEGGTKAKIKAKHIKADELMILLYLIVKQVAQTLRMDHRGLMNKIIDLDKIIEKDKKQKKKEQYKIIQKAKHQK